MNERRLGGRYEIKSRVGGGGMAIVYKGHDLLLDRTVAIKVLRSQYGTDDDFIKRFRREAQAAARLTHPNVVSIYDVGQDEETHYIVMEYVEGETLKDLIRREAPLPVEKAVNIAIQIAEALDNAHQHQIIHRDIKPHNILIGKNGRIKVTDFGIARAVTSATITQTGSVLGSVHYFSPEQAKGGLTGEKSDIYSLGVVLYEMVTGHLPFSGESPISVALKHLQEDFQEPREINPGIPQSVENIILKSLSKDPDQRYGSARELVKDLQTCLSSERLNEAKYMPVSTADMEEDPTIIIPAIREPLSDPHRDAEYASEEEMYQDEWEENRPRRKWMKPVIWLASLAILFGIGIYVYGKIQSLFEVPEVMVPNVENLFIEDAKELLEEKGLTADIREENSKEVEEGYVIKQLPKEGEKMKKGTAVFLTVSKGKQTITMPGFVGKTKREAEDTLRAFKDLQYEIEEVHDSKTPAGIVMEQDPSEGTVVVPEETKVVLTVSLGAETFTMPSLIGKSVTEAENILLKNGLVPKEDVKKEPSYFDEGIVFDQWPVKAGEKVSKGMEITLYVSSGLKPDAVGYDEFIPILTNSNKESQISIRITDARYTDYEIVSKKVSGFEEIPIHFVLAPGYDASYVVIQDGVQTRSGTITYNEIVGGD